MARICTPGLLMAVLVALSPGSGRAEEQFFFKDGDRVVMLGDSITEQHLYSNYVEMWTITRFPTWKITFRNVGIGGDRSPGGNGRFKRDVLFHKPTALTVDFGMNDGNYTAFNEAAFKVYMDGLRGIAKQAKDADVRVAWLTPSPVEKSEDGPALKGYNETLEKYSAGVEKVAQENQAPFVDQFHPFIKVLDQARAANPKNRVGGGDPVHPGPPGQAIMAMAILEGMHFPSLVSSVCIDATEQKCLKAERCKVTDLSVKDGRVRFQRRDEALPFFPKHPGAENILKWLKVHDGLNRYLLQVKGLPAGSYAIRLGGKKVAQASAEELASGLNLAEAALKDGPVAEQASKVQKAVEDKNRYYHDHIFRGVVLAGVPDFLALSPEEIEAKKQAAIKKRMEKLPELDEAVRKALDIQPHEVEITPVAGQQ
jgi:lysophospholipase L1-like esterase